MALPHWVDGVSFQPCGSCTEPRLSWEVAPTVVPECTLLVTFLHCSGSVLPSLKTSLSFYKAVSPC